MTEGPSPPDVPLPAAVVAPLLKRPVTTPRTLRLVALLVVLGVAVNVAVTLVTTERQTLAALRAVTPAWLVLAGLLATVAWLMEALRLLVWARFLGRPLTLRDTLRAVWAGQVASALAPVAVGNAAGKAAMLVERGLTAGEAAAVETLSVLEDLLFFAVALPVAALATGAWDLPVAVTARHAVAAQLVSPWVRGALIGAVAAAALIVWAVVRRRGRLLGVRDILRDVWRRGRPRLVLTVALMAVHWACRYSVITALAFSLGVRENPLQLFFLQWFVFAAMTVVPLPGAALGAESAFFFVYGGVLPGWSVGVLTAGWRFFSFYLPVIVAAVLLVVVDGRRRADTGPGG